MAKTNKTVTVMPTLDPKTYKVSTKRHRGPVDRAVPGTAKRSASSKKR